MDEKFISVVSVLKTSEEALNLLETKLFLCRSDFSQPTKSQFAKNLVAVEPSIVTEDNTVVSKSHYTKALVDDEDNKEEIDWQEEPTFQVENTPMSQA